MPKALRTATTRKKKAASVPDASSESSRKPPKIEFIMESAKDTWWEEGNEQDQRPKN